MTTLAKPIAILDEHPQWSSRLMRELERRGLPYERIDHASHGYDPADRGARHSVLINRSSPSSHRRGHGGVLFYTEALLAHFESLGVPVINPVASYRFEKSKALQAGLFERLGLRYPKTIVVNDRARLLAAADQLRYPVLVKPNLGGSGALIERFDSREELAARAGSVDLGPDGVALVQENIEAEGSAIVRVEILDGRFLYAIKIARKADDFNLCPADLCQVPAATPAAACPIDAKLAVERHEPPREAIDGAIALARAASIDVGGIEYLVGKNDGKIYFYDVNATSNFVADAPTVLGFDPFVPFVDYVERIAAGGVQRLVAA